LNRFVWRLRFPNNSSRGDKLITGVIGAIALVAGTILFVAFGVFMLTVFAVALMLATGLLLYRWWMLRHQSSKYEYTYRPDGLSNVSIRRKTAVHESADVEVIDAEVVDPYNRESHGRLGTTERSIRHQPSKRYP